MFERTILTLICIGSNIRIYGTENRKSQGSLFKKMILLPRGLLLSFNMARKFMRQKDPGWTKDVWDGKLQSKGNVLQF